MTVSKTSKTKPNFPSYLLWEYDLDTFDYQKSYKILIERVLQMGSPKDWKEMILFYSNQEILETIDWSAQIDKYEKEFSKNFLKSDYLDAV